MKDVIYILVFWGGMIFLAVLISRWLDSLLDRVIEAYNIYFGGKGKKERWFFNYTYLDVNGDVGEGSTTLVISRPLSSWEDMQAAEDKLKEILALSKPPLKVKRVAIRNYIKMGDVYE